MSRDSIFSLVSRVRAATNDYLLGELAAGGIEGLAPSHGDILAALFRRGELGMTELAEEIRRRKNTLTVLVAKLEAAGYVSRRQDPGDGRRSVVALTAKGRALRRPFARISRDLIAKGLDGIGDAELATTVHCLQRMVDNLRA